MRNTRIHRRCDDACTEIISEYIADMNDEELYVYVKEVFMMDPDDDYVGHDAEIAINCAMTAFSRASDTAGRSAEERRDMNRSFMELIAVLEQHNIITRNEIKEICVS